MKLTSSCPSAQINFSVKAVPLGMIAIPISVLCVLAQQVVQERSVNPTATRDTMATQGLSGKFYNSEMNIIIPLALTRSLFRNYGEILMSLAYPACVRVLHLATICRTLCEGASRSLQDTVSRSGYHRQQRLAVWCKSEVLNRGQFPLPHVPPQGTFGSVWRCF